MSGTRTCPACGAVAPGRVGRCPSCGARAGRSRASARLAGALAALVAVAALAWAVRPRPVPPATMGVRVTQGVTRLVDGDRATEVAATIDNPNRESVDVTVRIRGHDITGRVVVEETLVRGIPPGGPHPIRAHLDATPLDSLTFEAIDVRPINRPDP